MKQTVKIIQKVGSDRSNFSLDEHVTLRLAVATPVLLTRSEPSLFSRVLQRNKIKSITKKAFEGLEALEDL